jgi:hypothetical protein
MYAGILGPVAFATILARGLIDAGGVEATLKFATLCLFAFAGIGYVAGRIADLLVTESVRTRFEEELQAHEATAADQAAESS